MEKHGNAGEAPFGRSPADGFGRGTGYEGRANDEISLREILDILRKGRWIIAGCFLLVTVLTGVYTFSLAPEYEASSLVYVNVGQSGPQLGQLLGLETGNRNIANEIEILRSRTISMQVADRLILERRLPGAEEDFSVLEQKNGTPVTRLEVAERLRKDNLQAKPVGRDVDLINIVVTGTQPEEAAHIANLYASLYVEYNRTASRSRMTASREFLDDATSRFYSELQQAEADVMEFLDRERVVAPDEEARQLLGQVADIQRLQYQAQLEMGTAETALRELSAEIERIVPGLAAQLASGDDLVVDGLTRQIAEKTTELEGRYARSPALRTNPDSDAATARLVREIGQMKDELNLRSARMLENVLATGGIDVMGAAGQQGANSRLAVLQTLRRQVTERQVEVQTLRARQVVIGQTLASYQERLNAIPNQAIILNRLERAQQTREQLYMALMEKLQEARIAERSELGYVEVVDEAVVPTIPVRPRKALNLMLGMVLGMILGLGMAFVRHAMDHKVRRPEDLISNGMSVIGVVPDMADEIKRGHNGQEEVEVDGRRYRTTLVSLLEPLSAPSESYRRLRTNVQFSRPDTIVQMVVVTSGSPGEGKSTTAANLAITMAQAGRRTLLLDADLRKPSAHKIFGQNREPGLVGILFSEGAPDFEGFATNVDELYFIPAGAASPNPSEILGSRKMREFLRLAREHFDVIVIDTPPVLTVADAVIVSTQADGTIYVTTAAQTDLPAVESGIMALQNVGAYILGAVVNKFDHREAYGRYGYGYRYGGGYGYGHAERYYGEISGSN
jgi:capsular exopolysaccharide synthesis family protein